MDFLKKNWSKITIATLMFLAGLVYIIALITSDAKKDIFKGDAASVAAIVFFWGMTAYLIAKMLDQDWAKYVLLGTGVIGTIFAGALLVHSLDALSKIPAAVRPSMFEWLVGGMTTTGTGLNTRIVPLGHAFTFLVIFGLVPLVRGINKVVKGCCGTEKKASAAPKAAAK